MKFQLAVFLYLYLGFLLVWLLFSLAGIYHMLRYGFKNMTTLFAILVFLVGSFVLLVLSAGFIARVDWGAELAVFGNLFTNSLDF